MSVIARIAALMQSIRPEDFLAMPPSERRRFADTARHLAGMAEPKPALPKSGVLAELQMARGHQ